MAANGIPDADIAGQTRLREAAQAAGAPIAELETTTGERAGAFLEALGEGAAVGRRYRIRVIRAGLSGNGNFYPDAVLREAAPLFDGVRVFVKGDAEHLAGGGKDVRNLIGRLAEPNFVEGAAPDSGELQAVFELIEPEGAIGVKLREAWSRGMTALFGFSIDAAASARKRSVNGKTFREATKFRRVDSVDLIVEPGAGGQIINLIEARASDRKESDIMDRQQIIALIEAARPDLKAKITDTSTDAEIEALLREGLASPVATAARQPGRDGVKADTAAGAADATQAAIDAAVRMVEARAHARATIAASTLPQPAKDKLLAEFAKRERFAEADVEAAIKAERDYVARFAESGRVTGLGELSRIEAGESRADKVKAMLDAFFDPTHKDHKHARSFRECYVDITGDRGLTGLLGECDQARLRESLDSASWANVLGDSITRRMVADYRVPNQYDSWRQVVGTTVPITDFRTQERMRWGGYGDIPIVGQGQPYTALASPDDEKATYAIAKRGGTEDITLEMIANDDVGQIRAIPTKLSRASKRTLAKFVWDFVRTNPTIYDGVAFFHASHNNLGSAALSTANLAAARLAMLKQTERDSNDRLGIGPKSLVVPADLEETAVDLFRRSTNNDKTFTQSLVLDIIPVWYWTDVTDWAVAADPLDLPSIEIGFFQGREEPELFVQDNPTVGSMFSHDKITYKLRHIFGGNVIDYRGWFKAVVAG